MPSRPRSPQSGVALLIVLWACTLAAIVLGGLASAARVESLQARVESDQARAHYAALGGIDRAVYALRISDTGARWIADGREYRLRLGESDVHVAITDDDGKINLNAATPELLNRLLVLSGLTDGEARGLVSALQEWRSHGVVVAPGEDGAPPPAALGGFASIEELQTVPGMTRATYLAIEPALTLWSVNSTPSPAHADALAGAASTGLTLRQTIDFIARRRGTASLEYSMPMLPNGMQVLGGGGSSVVSIDATATTASGVTSRVRVTVQVLAQVGDNRAYKVLRWQEDGS
jgi:general secretion pathway protein K